MFKDRKKEHEMFLDWLFRQIMDESPNALIVAGDIFDASTPPNHALRIYYTFLSRVAANASCHVIIVGGNHDSASALNAPKRILESLNVHVSGGSSKNIEDDLILVKDPLGTPLAMVCATPFLRDKEIRKSFPGESYTQKNKALIDGIKRRYEAIRDAAMEKIRRLDNPNIPLIATGHLFATGGQTHQDDGLREIHVGSLGDIPASIFPKEFDYVALGHLHRPQKIEGPTHIRYSGAPIPLSFSEAENKKQATLVEWNPAEWNLAEWNPAEWNPAEWNSKAPQPLIRSLPIPCFQKLCAVKGSLEHVLQKMTACRKEIPQNDIRVEAQVMEETWRPDIEARIHALAETLSMDILAIKNIESARQRRLKKESPHETLDDFSPMDVFKKRLEKETDMTPEIKADLIHAFAEIETLARQNTAPNIWEP